MKKIYWTMKNGDKIDIDSMDLQHLKNTLKMLVRNNLNRVDEEDCRSNQWN